MSAIDRIDEFNKFGSILGLERMSVLMELLGNPQEALKCIHVAGTNGKGSCCRYIYEALLANGYSLVPAVGGSGSGRAGVLNVNDGGSELVEEVVFRQIAHPAVDSHGAAEACGELNKELGAGLVELFHVGLEFFEHAVVLPEPLAAGDTHGIANALHTGEDQADAVLRAVEEEGRATCPPVPRYGRQGWRHRYYRASQDICLPAAGRLPSDNSCPCRDWWPAGL